jgi:hypothetical protein
MTRTLGALAAVLLGLVLVAGTFDTAEARRGGGFRMGGHGHIGARAFAPRFAARPFVGRHAHFGRHRHFRRGFIIGAPLAYGAYSYGYGYGYGSCRWLRYRALETGSRYWWSRYHACINGYYY